MTEGMSTQASAVALFALGAFHGLNPGMGWLFAVALGLQEKRRRAVWRALLPLGLGHALAVVVAVGVAITVGFAIPMRYLQWAVAVLLIGMGIARLIRHRHPRWAQMRVNMRGLTLWSFLMASAHGAGMMVIPLFLGMAVQAEAACHASGTTVNTPVIALTATAIHAVAYLSVTAVIAIVVYEKLGLAILRRAWINLDLIWAAALVATGVLTLAM